MRETSTYQVKETTIYRILGEGHAHIGELILRDRFTLTLLALVLMTNLLILIIPATAQILDLHIAREVCPIVTFSLLPGYVALLSMLISRCGRASVMHRQLASLNQGQLLLSRAPKLRNLIIGIQCLLFASLLCSTFILRQQLSVLKQSETKVRNEHVLRNVTPAERLQAPALLPLLRQYMSI